MASNQRLDELVCKNDINSLFYSKDGELNVTDQRDTAFNTIFASIYTCISSYTLIGEKIMTFIHIYIEQTQTILNFKLVSTK